DGKALIVFAGDRVDPAVYARTLVDRVPLLPLRPTGVKSYAERGETGIDRASMSDASFLKFRDDETYATFAQVKTQKLLETSELPAVDGKSPSRVLVRTTDNRPLMSVRSVGAGTVALVSTSADVSWTDLPLWVNAYVPLVDALTAHLLLAETDAHNT